MSDYPFKGDSEKFVACSICGGQQLRLSPVYTGGVSGVFFTHLSHTRLTQQIGHCINQYGCVATVRLAWCAHHHDLKRFFTLQVCFLLFYACSCTVCMSGSECCQNVGDLHSALRLNVSCVDADLCVCLNLLLLCQHAVHSVLEVFTGPKFWTGLSENLPKTKVQQNLFLTKENQTKWGPDDGHICSKSRGLLIQNVVKRRRLQTFQSLTWHFFKCGYVNNVFPALIVSENTAFIRFKNVEANILIKPTLCDSAQWAEALLWVGLVKTLILVFSALLCVTFSQTHLCVGTARFCNSSAFNCTCLNIKLR